MHKLWLKCKQKCTHVKFTAFLSSFNHDWNWPHYVYSLKNLCKTGTDTSHRDNLYISSIFCQERVHPKLCSRLATWLKQEESLTIQNLQTTWKHTKNNNKKKKIEILISANKRTRLNSSKTKWTIFKIHSFWISFTGLSVQISWTNVLLSEMSMVQMLNLLLGASTM